MYAPPTYNLNFELDCLLLVLDGRGTVVSLVQEGRHVSNVPDDLCHQKGEQYVYVCVHVCVCVCVCVRACACMCVCVHCGDSLVQSAHTAFVSGHLEACRHTEKRTDGSLHAQSAAASQPARDKVLSRHSRGFH